MKLRQATPAECVARRCLTHSAWGARLTLEQYLAREERLDLHPFTQESRVTWVLAHGPNLLASCEAYRMNSILREGESLAFGDTYAIATVFVEPQLRGQGFAGKLLEHLITHLKKLPKAFASILFSEVGTGLYEQVGYIASPSSSRLYKPAPGNSELHVADTVADADVEKLLQGTSSKAGPRSNYRVVPTKKQIDWHVQRACFYAQVLERKAPESIGAQADEAWALCAPDYKNERLVVLALAPGLPDGTRAVIEAARRECQRYELSEVLIWENSNNMDRLVGGWSVPREGDIPMILPLQPTITAKDWTDYSRALWV